jgi:phosphoglycolate phosphatase-like HAD superfamily hydrolase
VALGVPRERITFGALLADACAELGVSVEEYLAHYDPALARPYAGVEELLGAVRAWSLCSHKMRVSGTAELARLRWSPEVALFAEDFQPGGKDLAPVLSELGIDGSDVVFVGDTAHDRRCALAVGATFVLAGWNARAVAEEGDVVASHPRGVLEVLVR